MNPIRKAALSSLLTLQSRSRKECVRQLCAENRAPMSVLFYHRVADDFPNGWTISCADFQRHIDYCREHMDFISLAEVQRRIREQHSPTASVTLTFDDGYADNCHFALPALIRERIPCTYFVATAHVRESKSFEHDIKAGHELPVNSVEEIRAAADAGIEIGLHTANHVDFNQVHTYRELTTEISDAKAELERMIDREVHYFAVPIGLPKQMRPAVFETARRCGLRGICSAFGAYNHVGDDPFHIQRIHGDPEFIRLKNWLSYDPRKLRLAPQLIQEDVIDIRETPPADWEASSCEPVAYEEDEIEETVKMQMAP